MKTSLACLMMTLLTACFPFGKKIEKQSDDFIQQRPQPFYEFEGVDRKMRAAWAGDVTKRPLILIHGSPGSWKGWASFLLDDELQKQFHIIAVDRAGYGGSGAGDAEPSLEKQAADLAPVLKFNQSGLPAIVVGHSYGGPVAVQLALDDPDKIAALVIAAGSIDPELEFEKWYQRPASWFSWFVPRDLDICNREILPLKSELQKQQPRWAQLKTLITVLQGDKDELVPPGNADYAQKMAPPATQIEIVRIPGMNHFIPWARPDLIKDAVLKLNQKLR